MPDLVALLRKAGITPARHGAREWSAPCPRCGGSDRFRIWPARGRWFCRGCDQAGDAIALAQLLDPAMSYPAACRALGIEPRPAAMRPASANPSAWTPALPCLPSARWQDAGRAFVQEAHARLLDDPSRLAWLADTRGLTVETVKRFRLGWAATDSWRDPQEWGLPEELRDDGKALKLMLPAGLVIPSFRGFALDRIQVRLPKGGYRLVRGSDPGSVLVAGKGELGAVIVESDLDALLIAQEAGDLVAAVSLRSATTRPNRTAHAFITARPAALVALDSDEAGARNAHRFWMTNYPTAIRWPTPYGKDPAEAWKAGLPIRSWVAEGLNASGSEPASQASTDSTADPEIIEERAAILEHDAGLTRSEANRLAGVLASGQSYEGAQA